MAMAGARGWLEGFRENVKQNADNPYFHNWLTANARYVRAKMLISQWL